MTARVEKRFGIVGSDPAARSYLQVLCEFPELRFDLAVTSGEERCDLPAEVRRFQRIEDLIRYREIPDVALLCTPPGEHLEDGEALLRSGIDLLVLGPLATRFEDAERLIETAERSGRELTTATPARLSPALHSAQSALGEGLIGALHYVGISLSEKTDARASWRGEPSRSGGGVWMQLGPQALDLAQMLAGRVERVRMLELSTQQGAGVDDEVWVECDHGDDRRSRLRLSWNEQRTDPIAHCVGETGELLVGPSQTILRRDSEDRVWGPGFDLRDACRSQIAEHLRRRCSLNPPIDSGPETVAWIEAAYRSLRDQRWHS